MQRSILICIFLFLAFSLSQGQTGLQDSVFHDHLPEYYAHKVQGRIYINPYPAITDHQFFLTNKLSAGAINYKEDTLHSDQILYDIYRDHIIVFSDYTSEYVELEEEFINSFSMTIPGGLEEYQFVNSAYLEAFPASLQPGFYMEVYNSSLCTFLRKKYKNYSREPFGKVYRAVFLEMERLIFRRDQSYVILKKKKNLLELYPGHEEEIKLFQRTSKIKIKNASDNELRELGAFLDSIVE